MSVQDLHHYSHSKVMLLIKDRNDVVSPKCVVLVVVGERHKGLQKRLSRNEVAECLNQTKIQSSFCYNIIKKISYSKVFSKRWKITNNRSVKNIIVSTF